MLVLLPRLKEYKRVDESPQSPYAIYFSHAKELPACFQPVQKMFASSPSVVLKLEMNLDDIEYQVKSGQKCIVLLTIADRDDLARVVNSLFLFKQEIKDRKVIAMTFLKFSSEKVEDLLSRSGVSDLLKFDTSAKAFSYKLNRQLKILMRELSEDSESNLRLIQNKSIIHERKSRVSVGEALTGDADFWLFPGKFSAQRHGLEWFIEIVGPSQAVGIWQKSDSPDPVHGLDQWQWVPHANHTHFTTDFGIWQFTGKKPSFNPKLNRWGFLSLRPELSLVEKNEIIQSKFRLIDPDHLNVSSNSLHAQNLFDEMKKSFFLNTESSIDSADYLPWVDHSDSGKLFISDWAEKSRKLRAAPEKIKPELAQILTGEEAMKPCGLKASIKGLDVELIELTLTDSTLKLGIKAGALQKKEIVELTVTSQNFGSGTTVILKGIVTAVEPEENGDESALVLMLQDSGEEFKLISESMEKRQDEVFFFFKKVKGLI